MVVGKYLRASINIKEHKPAMQKAVVMGRRRKKVVRIPKKRLPKFFSCPKCGKETVRVEIFREEGRAMAGCSSCGFQEEFQVKPAQGEVDVYCMLTDRVYSPSKRTSITKAKTA
jgi:transcription elongation factor Elf1